MKTVKQTMVSVFNNSGHAQKERMFKRFYLKGNWCSESIKKYVSKKYQDISRIEIDRFSGENMVGDISIINSETISL